VTYTGTGSNATVGHGLGAKPNVILLKDRAGFSWVVYFAVTTAGAPSFTIGTETVTAGANVSPTTAGQITVGLGDETAFGEAFQNIINFSVGTPNFFIWNEVDDSQTVTWIDVEPGSTD
jgi:hypothetical protein